MLNCSNLIILKTGLHGSFAYVERDDKVVASLLFVVSVIVVFWGLEFQLGFSNNCFSFSPLTAIVQQHYVHDEFVDL